MRKEYNIYINDDGMVGYAFIHASENSVVDEWYTEVYQDRVEIFGDEDALQESLVSSKMFCNTSSCLEGAVRAVEDFWWNQFKIDLTNACESKGLLADAKQCSRMECDYYVTYDVCDKN